MASATNYQDLPFNHQAEQAVLGATFINKDALYTVLSELLEEDFYEGKHKLIYRAIKNLTVKKMDVDILTVTEELMNAKELENIGGVDYLKECSDVLVAISSLEYYIKIVRDNSTLRQMLITIRKIDKDYKAKDLKNIEEFISNSELQFNDVLQHRKISSFITMKEISDKVGQIISEASQKEGGSAVGVSTGYERIDFYTLGFQPGEVTVIGARPGVGKTALALNFAYNAAMKNVPVAFFSLEMTDVALGTRLLSIDSQINSNKLKTGNLSAQELAKLRKSQDNLARLPLYVDQTSNASIMDIIAKSRQLQAKVPNLGLIMIDYLGLIGSLKNSNEQSRQEEVRKISGMLTGLAKDLRVPIVVLSQLSRISENRDKTNHRPMISDLKDSGAIEADASVIMLLYREDYYDSYQDDKGKKKMKDLTDEDKAKLSRSQLEKNLAEKMPGDASYIEVNIAKNRNGQVGKVGLFFFKNISTFETPSKEWEAAKEQLAFDD